MAKFKLRMVGAELYFDDLERAKQFYRDTLGLDVTKEAAGQFAQFDAGNGFICLERKGAENYPSQDKAVLFLEVADLTATVRSLGSERIVRYEPKSGGRSPWAVLHDPEGHNIVLRQASKRKATKR
jgi:predicted enzyme related to lactoylglutathione lyase